MCSGRPRRRIGSFSWQSGKWLDAPSFFSQFYSNGILSPERIPNPATWEFFISTRWQHFEITALDLDTGIVIRSTDQASHPVPLSCALLYISIITQPPTPPPPSLKKLQKRKFDLRHLQGTAYERRSSGRTSQAPKTLCPWLTRYATHDEESWYRVLSLYHDLPTRSNEGHAQNPAGAKRFLAKVGSKGVETPHIARTRPHPRPLGAWIRY